MADEAPTPDEGGNDANDGGRTFTQAQLDKIVEERLARERQKYADYDDLKKAAGQLKQLEDAKKSDEQKLLERVEAAEQRAQAAEQAVKQAESDALRARVAASHGLTDAQAKRLQGDTLEELTADAVEVFGEPKKADEPDDSRPGPGGRPKEKLRPGASNDGDETPDYEGIAEKIASAGSF